MHFTGQVWRPPFEANNALLQITAGCMWNQCKFCSLYEGTNFQMSPIAEVEEDLAELKQCSPDKKRVFLTGANPFGLHQNKLKVIGNKIKEYLPNVETIGGFSRIADIKRKSVEELKELRELGFDGIHFGTETGDEITLEYMNKGNSAKDIVEQLHKLDEANMKYNVFHLNGLAGKGSGQRNALESAKIYNQINPESINVVALTIFPGSVLYEEVQNGTYVPASEIEKLLELKTFIENLNIETQINANTISNTAPFVAHLPKDKEAIISLLERTCQSMDEEELTSYRNNIRSL